jgi:hypothetical protein
MQIKTLYDIHNFANGLLYKLLAGELPTNVSVRIELGQVDWINLQKELLDMAAKFASPYVESGLGWFSYQYMSIKFYIYLKQGE